MTGDDGALMTQVQLPSSIQADLPLTIYHDFDHAAPIWHKLELSAPRYAFQSYDWLLRWHQTIGNALCIEPFVVAVTDGADRELALFPLGIRRRLGCRILEFLGAVVTDYNAPLFAPQLLAQSQVIEQLWERIVASARPDLVRLLQMPEHLPGKLMNPMASLRRVRYATSAYETTLPATFSDFARGRSAKYFHETRRKRRKLSSMGEVRFVVHHNPDDIVDTVNLLLAQKRRKYGPRYVNPAIMPAFEEFYRRIALVPVRGGRSIVASLRVDDIAVATGFGVLQDGRYYGLMLGHEDGKWAGLSPGRSFLWELVRWCVDEGVEIFDLCIGDEDYKHYWCDCQTRLYESQRPLNPLGAAFLVTQQLNAWRQRSR